MGLRINSHLRVYESVWRNIAHALICIQHSSAEVTKTLLLIHSALDGTEQNSKSTISMFFSQLFFKNCNTFNVVI